MCCTAVLKEHTHVVLKRKKTLSHRRRRRNHLQSTSANAKMWSPRLLWLITALPTALPAAALTGGTTVWLLTALPTALPAAALTPGTTAAPPPKATNWWDAFFAPNPQPLLVRDDSTRLRRGTREDAPRIRSLWAANVAPNSLGEAWSPGGIETAFVYRKTRDRLCGNQNLGTHLQNCICAMAWTTRLTH